MFNSKKIKALEDRMGVLEEMIKNIPDKVKDENTGYLMWERDTVGVKTIIERVRPLYSSIYPLHYTEESVTYFKKGTEPQCDLIDIDRDGNKKYLKNNVEVDEKGNCKKIKS